MMVVQKEAHEGKEWRQRGAHAWQGCRSWRDARTRTIAVSSSERCRRIELEPRLLPAVRAAARGVHAQQPQDLYEREGRHRRVAA